MNKITIPRKNKFGKTAEYYEKYHELARFLKQYPDIEEVVIKLIKYRKKMKDPSLQAFARSIIKSLRSKKNGRIFLAMLDYCSSN